MPTDVGGNSLKNSIICRRRSRLRSTASPAAFTPCSSNKFFDVSIPMRIICSTDGLLFEISTTSSWHIDAVGGRPPQQSSLLGWARLEPLWIASAAAPPRNDGEFVGEGRAPRERKAHAPR